MTTSYVELHTHSFYSFGVGASHPHELIDRALKLSYPALALTDTNLCGALEFARMANEWRLRPITGGEITLKDGSHLTLLVRDRKGYANLSQLFTYANMADRREPTLNPTFFAEHTEGLFLLTGCSHGQVPRLVSQGKYQQASDILRQYVEWFGSDAVYVELQQHRQHGDTQQNQRLLELAKSVGVPVVATNNAHYHAPERHKLQNVLTAARNNSTLDEALPLLKLSPEFHLKSGEEMGRLFDGCPEAIANTLRIAEACPFNLSTDLGYKLPAPPVPEGYTPETYLERLCLEAVPRRYGGISEKIQKRLNEEFSLVRKHDHAGFLLLYHEIVRMAQTIMVEQGLADPEMPVELRPPGRGRGSSVALVIGYLLGISHVDPMVYDLTLERFLPEDAKTLPDIDLDFPRALRDQLIDRIHKQFGPEHAVLTGAITKYRLSGVIADLGKVMGLPQEDLKAVSKVIHAHDPKQFKAELLQSPEHRSKVNMPGWRDLLELAPQLIEAPKRLGQHVGGMILSSSPIPEMVPIREGAIEGRYILDWDKDSIADAGFAKIDILSLPVLDQIEEAVNLIEAHTGQRLDLSQVDPEDPAVYDLINAGRATGVFLLQSPAQLKMGQRLKSRNFMDLAYQVALIRPGVGMQGSAVSQFVERYRHGVPWEYDHYLEKRALERGYGIIVWQEQVVQLIMDVAGMTSAEADEIRRAFAKAHNEHLIEMYWERFRDGAMKKGVPEDVAKKIYGKVNGHYMFPESHSYAFAISAYQAAYLKCHYPLEFFVALMNNQPMGFYPIEALKEDARRHGVTFQNPCVNRSAFTCLPAKESVLVGLRYVKDVGEALAKNIIEERERSGPYVSVGDLVQRTGVKHQTVESLVMAGAFDSVAPNRKVALWEAGLYQRPTTHQMVLPMSMDQDVPQLEDFTDYERMLAEYRVMGMYPRGHIMEFLRPALPSSVLTTTEVEQAQDGEVITVAGWPIARQHPRGESGTTFITIEDEYGDIQLVVWPQVFAEQKSALHGHVLQAQGTISRWDGTTNIVVSQIKPIPVPFEMPQAHDWH